MARFDCAVWRPISCNTSGTLAPNLGLILHHAVADGSLYNFFNSPSAQVSAHFWVAQDGTVEQYVDTDVVAWHGMQLNGRYVGVETEGCGAPPHAEPMTNEMVAGLAAIYAEGHARHGWPFITIESDGQAGFGYHRMAVATACPCDARLARRADILELAAGGTLPAPTPPAEPPAQGATGVPAWPGRYLKYPPVMQGTDVTTWQAQMSNVRGWSLTVDGQYGPQSAQVCADFQAEKGLGVDGIVGPDTWAAAWSAPVT